MKRQIDIHEKLPFLQALPLAVQHVFAMFGATVLVPFLTGLDPAVALLTSGIGTLIFHFFTKGKVPAYLGSSFAYIAGIAYMVKDGHGGVSAAMGAALMVGLAYIIVYFLIKAFGVEAITRFFPTVVVGPVVMIIGLSLAGTAVNSMASVHWPTAIFTLVAAILFSVFGRGFAKVIPILLGITAGYIFAAVLNMVHPTTVNLGGAMVPLFSFQGVIDSLSGNPLNWPKFVVPSFNMATLFSLAPLAFVTIIEDLGHIMVIGNVTNKNLMKDPGFDNVLLGNGLATAVASFFGGPPSTTYGENIGVLAVTKVYSAWVIRIAAIVAICLSFLSPIRALVNSIPVPVMGGIVILLFGMIAAAGMRTLVEAKTDLSSTRNLIIVSIILILGIGVANHGVAYATLAGIILNIILPQEKDNAASNAEKEVAATKAE